MIGYGSIQLMVLDTNVASLLMGDPNRQESAQYRAMVDGKAVGLPVAVISELMQGALMDGWGARRREALSVFINRLLHLDATYQTAYHAAYIRAECRRHGITASENDAWIAATARSLDSVLVSHDRDHLRMQTAVPDLRVFSLLQQPQ